MLFQNTTKQQNHVKKFGYCAICDVIPGHWLLVWDGLCFGCKKDNNNNNFIYPGKDRSVDQDIDWLVLIGDQYKKHKKKSQ